MQLDRFKGQMEKLGQLWKEGYLITEYNLGDKKIKLLDSQIEFINAKDKFVLDVGGFGCLPGYAPIKTSNGDVEIKDIKIGDKILGESGDTTKKCCVVNKIYSGKKEVFRIYTVDGKYVDATREHIFAINRQYWVHGKYRKETEEWSVDKIIKYLDNNRLNSKNIGFIRPKYISYPDRPKLEVDPYLLGILLGDGSILGSITLFSDIPDIAVRNRVNERLKKYNCSLKKYKADFAYGVVTHDTRSKLIKAFRELGVKTNNKFIPEKYFHSSRKNRLELLAGLIDSDGYQYDGKYEFVNKEKRLAYGYKRLVEELGGKATMGKKIVGGTTYYRVYSALNCKVPCALKRKQNKGKQQRNYAKHRIDGYKSLGVMDTYDITIDNDSKRFLSYDGFITHNSGKTLSLAIKLILMSLCFPDNNILLGRKHLGTIEKALFPDIQKLMNPNWYHYRVKDGIVKFFNGSDIVFFGLDSLQSGGLADIKKSQQKIKGLNLGAFFIDQLEEVDYGTFDALRGRLRRKTSPWLQANMTSNPANYWAYDFFKANPRDGTKLIESSMLENREHLPDDYIEDQLNHDERYVKRFVYGEWTPDILTDRLVFAEEYITKFKPKKFHKEEGCEIYQDYDNCKYQIGVDPSEGVVDPSSISVVSEYGEKVAKFNGKIPIFALGEKVKFLYEKYHKPLIIPEVNAAGQALLLQIRDLNIFKRTVYDEKYDKQQEKLGWKTSYQTKQALISNFQELLRQDFPKIYDEGTINELQAFEWTDIAKQKGAGASPNFHDDDVMSTLLAFWGLSPKKIMKKRILQEYRRSLRKPKRFQYL